MKNRQTLDDLIAKLKNLCHEISHRKYDKAAVEELFELTKKGVYPDTLSDLAESFGMMMVRLEAREFRLEQTLEELERAHKQLLQDSAVLETKVEERTAELETKNELLEKEIQERKRAEEALQAANHELQLLADFDGLTRVATRRLFDETLLQAWKRLKREKQPLSLILIDVDHFKRFNDFYGHQAGDDCLRSLARAIAESVKRPGDLTARYGGEEFAVVLPNTPLEGARHLAELIRERTMGLNIPHERSGVHSAVTVSLGVASIIPDDDSDPSLLVQMADQALYEAKNAGRNRTVCRVRCA